jgi:transcription antitermination factor NusG
MSTGTQTMDKRWYIVHAYSNFEKKVSESIREQAKQRGLEDLFEQVLVPTEKVTEVRRASNVRRRRCRSKSARTSAWPMGRSRRSPVWLKKLTRRVRA